MGYPNFFVPRVVDQVGVLPGLPIEILKESDPYLVSYLLVRSYKILIFEDLLEYF